MPRAISSSSARKRGEERTESRESVATLPRAKVAVPRAGQAEQFRRVGREVAVAADVDDREGPALLHPRAVAEAPADRLDRTVELAHLERRVGRQRQVEEARQEAAEALRGLVPRQRREGVRPLDLLHVERDVGDAVVQVEVEQLVGVRQGFGRQHRDDLERDVVLAQTGECRPGRGRGCRPPGACGGSGRGGTPGRPR